MATYIISALQTVIIGLFLYYAQRKQNKRDKKTELAVQRRTDESLLQLELSSANGDLSYAVAMAIKRGQPNGEVEKAVEVYKEAKNKYYHFLNKLAMENNL